MRHIIDCCRSRKEPNAPVEVGHVAVCAPHLANVALKHGKLARLSEDAKQVTL